MALGGEGIGGGEERAGAGEGVGRDQSVDTSTDYDLRKISLDPVFPVIRFCARAVSYGSHPGTTRIYVR